MSFRNFLPSLKLRERPSRGQWKYFLKVLTKKEKTFFLVLCFSALSSLVFISLNFYLKRTEIKPKSGGTYTEGMVGQPRFINPLYANSDIDRDLTQLVFSGLMKYNEKMEIVPDLVKKYDVEEDGRVYKFYLKDNLLWEDKTPITADDVVFTIKAIQNPDYKSPLRANWIGVEIEKIGDSAIKLSLKKPYGGFLERCTLKILPAHIWQNITPENSPFDIYNLKAVGSGLYKINAIEKNGKNQVESLTLTPNSLYYEKSPYITKVEFLFFDNEEKLVQNARKGLIKGLSSNDYQDMGEDWNFSSLSLPRYFAVFFNQEKSKILTDEKVRTALNYGTNKEEIIKKILPYLKEEKDIKEKAVASPILNRFYGFQEPSLIYNFDPEKAKDLLDQAGYKDENQDGLREKIVKKEPAFQFKQDLKTGSQNKDVQELQRCLAEFPEIYPEKEVSSYFGEKTKKAVINFQNKYAEEILAPQGQKQGTGVVDKATRTKLNEICFGKSIEDFPLTISITTVDQPILVKTADILKEQWKNLGVLVEIQKFPVAQLEQEIKKRNYQGLLLGESLGTFPDLYPFWDSSYKEDPGLNLALYDNKKADDLLEESRETLDWGILGEKLNLFQNILLQDAPAVFLYTLDYNYFLSKDIKGFGLKKITDSSKRFIGVENWYIKTKRVWK